MSALDLICPLYDVQTLTNTCDYNFPGGSQRPCWGFGLVALIGGNRYYGLASYSSAAPARSDPNVEGARLRMCPAGSEYGLRLGLRVGLD